MKKFDHGVLWAKTFRKCIAHAEKGDMAFFLPLNKVGALRSEIEGVGLLLHFGCIFAI